MKVIEATLFFEAICQLGESPVWFEDRLWWVDIEAGELYLASAAGQILGRHPFGQRISAAAPLNAERFVVALQSGVGIFDRRSGRVDLVAFPDRDIPGNRCNDGKWDPVGRFVVGTLNMQGLPHQAALYSIECSGVLTKRLSSLGLSNGLAWSADGRILYHVDSKACEVSAFDYDLSTGQLENPRVVITVPPAMGLPDGMDIDAKGNLWIAHWGGFSVRCWSPESGQCVAEIPIECPQPTSCCFGGPRRDRLFITTARVGMSAAQLQQYPLSGSMFTCQPGAVGLQRDIAFADSHFALRSGPEKHRG